MHGGVRKRPAVARTVTLEALLAGSLDERWGRYKGILKKTREDPSEPQVHDLRVATRRLISTIDLFAAVMQDRRLLKIREELKDELNTFNPLRDTQVQLLTIGQLLPAYPVLEPFHTVLLLRERRSIKGIGRRINRVPVAAMEKDLQAIAKRLRSLLCTPTAREIAFAAVLGTATIAFARALERRHEVVPGDTVTIHRLRVAFKRVRYTLEALQPVFSGISQRQLKSMNEYQQLMGDIQDAEVLRASVSAYAARRQKSRDQSLLAIQRDLLRRRDQCTRKFLASADMLFSFWHQGFKPTVSLQSHSTGM